MSLEAAGCAPPNEALQADVAQRGPYVRLLKGSLGQRPVSGAGCHVPGALEGADLIRTISHLVCAACR